MKKIIRIVSLFFYYLIGSNLPSQHYPGGKYFNAVRKLFAKGIITIGNNSSIHKGVYFGSGSNIVIGDNCHINENIRLDNVIIGNNVMIARDTVLLGRMHMSEDISVPMNIQGYEERKNMVIDDDVWIGIRVIIMPGINIGKGSIIGAGSIVTKDVKPYSVVAGAPAKLIRKRK